jgi:uncharacterized membrane protein YhaH (DUF805 family)
MNQLFQKLFRGRLSRRNLLVADAVLSVAAILVQVFRERPASLETAGGAAVYVFAILLVFVTTSLTIRRLHDIGRSGWLVLFTYLPGVNIVLAVYTLVKKGEPGPNRYGSAPQPRISLRDMVGIKQDESAGRPPLAVA